MSKKEFQDLENPLLAWMIDYDAVATVLKVSPLTHLLVPCSGHALPGLASE